MRILEFQKRQEAQGCLDAINAIAAGYWQEQGYTIENGTLVGKNAATGEDEPDKQRTTTWDTVQESPEGTFYFTSLTGTPYEAGMEQLSGFNFLERPLPREWIPEEF